MFIRNILIICKKLPWYILYLCPGRCPPWNVSEWPPPWWWPPTAPGWSSSLATPAGNAKSPQLPVYSLGRKIDPASCSYYWVVTVTVTIILCLHSQVFKTHQALTMIDVNKFPILTTYSHLLVPHLDTLLWWFPMLLYLTCLSLKLASYSDIFLSSESWYARHCVVPPASWSRLTIGMLPCLPVCLPVHAPGCRSVVCYSQQDFSTV